jgi:hypothetical protein
MPNLTFVPSSDYKASSISMPPSLPNFFHLILISSSDDDKEDENPPSPTHLPFVESIEHEPAPAPQLSRWVRSTQVVAGDLVDDPIDQWRKGSQFHLSSSLLAQVSETRDLKTFVEASAHPNWDTTMNEEYHSLMANDT